MGKILMFEISAKKGLCYVICGSEVKTSDLAAHFSCNSGAANTLLFTIQTFNEHSRMVKLSEPYYEATCDETSQVNKSYVKE